MIKMVNMKNIEPSFSNGHYSYYLLGHEQLSETGVSVYICKEYQEPGVHEYNEGFYVLKGNGFIKCDSSEHFIEESMSFIVPYNVEHSLKCSEGISELRVFCFHIPISY